MPGLGGLTGPGAPQASPWPSSPGPGAAAGTPPPPQQQPAPMPQAGIPMGAQTIALSPPQGAAPPTSPAVSTPQQRMQQTMIGMPASLGPSGAPAAPGVAPAPSPSPIAASVEMPARAPTGMEAGRAPPPVGNRTMLGVAMPGIAPVSTGTPGQAAGGAAATGFGSTVAISQPSATGAQGDPRAAAPSPPQRRNAMTLPLQVQYVPPPEPLRELPVPAPPRIVRKKGGFPLVTVALILVGLLVAGAALIAVFYKGTPPIAGQPRATPDGKDVLHLVCDPKSCKDGTVVSFAGAKTAFAGGEADLPLTSPLHVGDNKLDLMVDCPGMGRDEVVKLVVPVAYRVSADVTTMGAAHPSVTIRVEAQPGTQVELDGKPLALDANGAGAYAVDETAATEGAADESRVVSVDVPYVVTLPVVAGAPARPPQKGTVSARVAVAPLRVDAPGARATVDEDKVLVAGRAAKGSTVTVDGASVTVGPDGAFETFVALPAEGDRAIDVRGGTALLTPRLVHVTVTRVASLADAAKAFEQQKTLGYDAVMNDITGTTGQPIVVDGDVLESRGSGHRTLALVDDKRGCAHGPCLVRVVIGRDLPLVRGDRLKAYAVVARPFTTPAKQTVPEVESTFVLRTKR